MPLFYDDYQGSICHCSMTPKGQFVIVLGSQVLVCYCPGTPKDTCAIALRLMASVPLFWGPKGPICHCSGTPKGKCVIDLGIMG